MAGIRKDFSLCETVSGALYNVCESYGIDGCWLPWKFERHVITGGATPYRITTADYPRNIQEGVDQVKFEIDFDAKNPNLVKYIRFDEQPSKRTWLVTQTSLKHVHEGHASCPLWIEIPRNADRLDIIGARSLLNAKLCCAEWKDHLPPSPETNLEKAHLIISKDDPEWLKRQVIFKDSITDRLTSSLACSRIEIAALTAEITKLNVAVAKTEGLRDRIEELKAELKTESKAKDTAVGELEGQIKSLKMSLERLQGTLKDKTGTITKLRRELKGKGTTREDETGSESPTPATIKKRKMAALKTPKGKALAFQTPMTAPLQHVSTPYSQSRLRNPSFSVGHGSPAVEAGGWKAHTSLPQEDALASDTQSHVPSLIILSSGSNAGTDGEVFN